MENIGEQMEIINPYEVYGCDGTEMVVVSKAKRNITDDIVLLMQLENLDRIYHKQKTEIGRYLRYCTTAEIMEINKAVNRILG